MCKASAQCVKSIYYSVPISYVEVEATESSKCQTRQKELFSSTVLMFLLLSASWQGIVNAPIDQTSLYASYAHINILVMMASL